MRAPSRDSDRDSDRESDRESDRPQQNGRRPFTNGRGGPQRNEDEELEYAEEDERFQVVLPETTTPKPRPTSKPIVCHTGSSNELYANPRNCR